MAHLFGRDYARKDLLGYTGNLSQLGGIRPVELASGRERGVRAFEVATGTGFQFTVLADRALDIAHASFRGRSLAFMTPGGLPHPAYYEPQGGGWLRTFSGGLLTTCGLQNVGAACVDAGQELGVHGRVSTLPVEEMGYWGEWHGDDYWMFITGSLTEGVIFGSNLRLTRRISARLGGNSLTIDDTVENRGGEPAPHMMLYHCNLGFPLLSEDSQLVVNSTKVTPSSEASAAGLADYMTFQPPTPGYTEQVFYHEMAADTHGEARVALVNPSLDGGLGLGIQYHTKSLPQFVQWKMMGYGTYVLGLEPSNCWTRGRADERARGTLQVLQPGETRDYHLEISVLAGPEEIDAYLQQIKVNI